MNTEPRFAAAVGNDQRATVFLTNWLTLVPCAIDSRLIDGLWVHQIYDERPDTLTLRAQLAVARHRQDQLAAKVRAS